MKVAVITRSTLYLTQGGDTIQVLKTVKYLRHLNVSVEIKLTNEAINYEEFDLIHFFGLIRPADILPHLKKLKKPFVVTPLLIDYSEFDKQYRKGLSGKIFRFFSADQIEYLKTVARWAGNQQATPALSFLIKGQRNSIKKILKHAAFVLPNSQMEYDQLVDRYGINKPYKIIPNGIEKEVFAAALQN